MTTYNKKKSILEKGGMMIEALAMLGLIAVVTPTMYKKSAERTLEVEDINTAAQMRTYMNAVEAYISGNYASIMADMTEHDHNQETYQVSKLTQFLPYGYATTNQLHDYGAPVISVIKEGNNLTGFLLFPANEDAENGIGRERTARIASLIGANGGYVREKNDEKYARGVGGVWRLEGGAYSAVFPEGSDVNENSIVIATANPVTGTAQGDLDNDKYLQRTKESDNQDELWRNTMRTDLYLGGYADHDPKNNDSESENTLHSIRNVNSLIIGAEEGTVEPGNGPEKYENEEGLYIKEGHGTHSNAYIGGTLKAVAGKFLVDENKLAYGDSYSNFEVTNAGDLTQFGKVALATNFIAGNGSVSIGKKKKETDEETEATEFILDATRTDGTTTVKMVNGNAFTLTDNSLTLMNGVNNTYIDIDENEIDLTDFENRPKYAHTQTYPVQIGSNTEVIGLLSASMIGTNELKSSSLEVGSDSIDARDKWLTVNAGGVQMGGKTRDIVAYVNNDGFSVMTGPDENPTATFTVKNEKVTVEGETSNEGQIRAEADSIRLKAKGENGDVTIMTPKVAQMVKDNEIRFGNSDAFSDDIEGLTGQGDYRVVFGQNGNVDLVDSNLRVVSTNDDETTYNILSVAGNKNGETGFDNSYSDALVDGKEAPYDMAVHGNVAFTGSLKKDENGHQSQNYGYLSIGRAEPDSGVSIVASGAPTDQDKQVLFVDLSKSQNAAEINAPGPGENSVQFTTDTDYTLDQGSIYIRKGMVAVLPEKHASDEGGTGTYGATSGYGVIKASRFVANNVDSNGNYIKVKQILKADTYNQYNGSNRNRYDTYMVNPAYTSVMHDIKLTTRGGARLSDVLPDFITKGIYVATNDYDDTLSNLAFSMTGTSMKGVLVGNTPPSRGSISWASPYAGSVPAPQCPPGYGRVVTVTPSNIKMAEAGGVRYVGSVGDAGASHWRVDPNTIRTSGNKLKEVQGTRTDEDAENINADIADELSPQYKRLKAEGSSVQLQGSFSAEGAPTLYSDAIHTGTISGDLNVVSAEGSNNTEQSEGKNKHLYVLTTKGHVKNKNEGEIVSGLNPLVFQQNTYLRTAAVPICASGKGAYYDGNVEKEHSDGSHVGDHCKIGDYTSGWAILLGFVYDSNWVSQFIPGVSVGSGGYWNLFPVEQQTLEAYVTTYCYFNRPNMESLGTPFIDNDYKEYADPYHPIRMGVPDSFEKKAGDAYLKRLNDPTLKYNEVW